jgi:osmotically inducible lipoprotein OsmB
MKVMQNVTLSIAVLALLAAGGCGSKTSDRALSGAGIGAGVGALGSAVLGGSAATGAVVGGAVGAAAGGLTKEEDINLGKPVWRD